MAWIIWLKSGRSPTFSHHCLDGHFPHIIQQHGGFTAGQGEKQAEVQCKVQMAWHLNMLPGGMPSLQDVNLDELDLFPLNSRTARKKGMPMVH